MVSDTQHVLILISHGGLNDRCCVTIKRVYISYTTLLGYVNNPIGKTMTCFEKNYFDPNFTPFKDKKVV